MRSTSVRSDAGCPLRLKLLLCFALALTLSQPGLADDAFRLHTHLSETQAAPCEFPISPTAHTFGPEGEDLYVVVDMDVPCDWMITGDCGWAAAERLDDHTVRVSVGADTGPARSCELTIAGQTFTVRQEAAADSPTVIAEPHVVQIGAPINVWFSGGPGDARDWIALYREDAGEDSRAYLAHHYLGGEHEGQLAFTAPMHLGVYEFRMLCCWAPGGYSAIAMSNPVGEGTRVDGDLRRWYLWDVACERGQDES